MPLTYISPSTDFCPVKKLSAFFFSSDCLEIVVVLGTLFKHTPWPGGPRGQVVEVADFIIVLNHLIILLLCLMWVQAPHESHVEQVKFYLRVCQVVFPRVFWFSPHPLLLARLDKSELILKWMLNWKKKKKKKRKKEKRKKMTRCPSHFKLHWLCQNFISSLGLLCISQQQWWLWVWNFA